MASKKAGTSSPRDYSAAVRKGWATRRIKKRAERLKAMALDASRQPRTKASEQYRKMIESQIEDFEREHTIYADLVAGYKRDQVIKAGIPLFPGHWLTRSNTLALYASRLRRMANTKALEQRLVRARKMSERKFIAKAVEMAEEFNVDVREVYALYFSP